MKNSRRDFVQKLGFGTAALLTGVVLQSCSSDSGDIDPDPIDPIGEDPDNGGTTSSPPSSADPTNGWGVNIVFTGKGVSHTNTPEISRGRKATFHGNTNYHAEYDLGNKAIGTILIANFNENGSYPTETGNMPRPNTQAEERNNTAVSFVFVDTIEEANAKIVINTPLVFAQTSVINTDGQSARKISSGAFTVQALSDHLDDNEPPLAFKKDGSPLTSVKYNAATNITNKDYNTVISKLAGTDPDVTIGDIRSMFGQNNNEILIRTIENVVHNGQDTIRIQQPNFN